MINKTREYLQRIINVCYGREFIRQLAQLTNYELVPLGDSMSGIYILDVLHVRKMNMWHNPKPCFYIVFNTNGVQRGGVYLNPKRGRARLMAFLAYLRLQPMYAHDYELSNDQHMVIIKFPKRFYHAYMMFLMNQYSNMYSAADLEHLCFKPTLEHNGDTVISLTYAVLTRNVEYGPQKVAKELQDNFGVDVMPEGLTEYDIPWLIRHEVYHHELMTEQEKNWLQLLRQGPCI